MQEFSKDQKRHFKLVGMEQVDRKVAGIIGYLFQNGWSLIPWQSLLGGQQNLFLSLPENIAKPHTPVSPAIRCDGEFWQQNDTNIITQKQRISVVLSNQKYSYFKEVYRTRLKPQGLRHCQILRDTLILCQQRLTHDPRDLLYIA